MARFLRLLSQNYQNLPSLDPAPSYIAHLPSDDPAPHKYTIPGIPELDQNFPRGTVPASLAPECLGIPVSFRLRPAQIAAVHAAVVREDPEGCVCLSRQDAITALLAECVTFADKDSPPVTSVSSVVTVSPAAFRDGRPVERRRTVSRHSFLQRAVQRR